MKIKNISNVKDFRIFKNWKADSNFGGFRDINLIYANNGSGKSTLASVLNPSLSEDGWNAGITIEVVDDSDGNPTNITSSVDPFWDKVVVFNRDYVDESFDFQSGEATALVSLGKADVDREKKLRQKKNDLETAEGKVGSLRDAKNKLAKNPGEILKQIGQTVTSNLGSIDGYNGRSYNAGSVKKRLNFAMPAEERKVFDVDVSLARARASMQKSIDFRVDTWTSITRDEIESIISRVPTAKPINDLKDNPDLSQWVQSGLTFHDEPGACRFCTQEFTIDRLAELQSHFDESTKTLQNDLGALKERINQALLNSEKIVENLPDEDRVYADLREGYVAESQRLKGDFEEVMELLKDVLSIVSDKESKLFEELHLDENLEIPESINSPETSSVVAIFTRHNEQTLAFEASVNEAAKKLESFWIGESSQKYTQAEIAAKKAADASSENDVLIKKLKQEIAQLESADFNPGPPAEWLTDRLHRLLGRYELEVQATNSSKYSILRDGEPAKHLSEGERTALSLLYFVKSLSNKGRSLRDLIIVIDDPVSSLDDSFTVGMSGLLWAELVQPEVCGCGKPKGCPCNLHKKPMRDCGQVFLFTHNFELFRMWTTQLDRLSGAVLKANRNYRVLELKTRANERSDGSIGRVPYWREWDPQAGSKTIRTKLRSEYHYLFLKAAETLMSIAADAPTAEDEMDAAVVLPNVCRRLLEGFFSFKYPEKMGDFREQVKAAIDSIDDGATRTRLVTYLHQYSHNEYIDTTRGVSRPEGPAILHSVFTLIREKDREHFDSMCVALGLSAEDLSKRIESKKWFSASAGA